MRDRECSTMGGGGFRFALPTLRGYAAGKSRPCCAGYSQHSISVLGQAEASYA